MMARPLRIEFPGAVYHVTSRGNERRAIFRDDEDRRRFLEVLDRTVARWRWVVHAYCLMGNHYHLVIETPEPNLSRGMRQLNGEYTQGFNLRHGRVGHLFQGRFKALLVEKESHLLELCRYVVLNPVRARGMRVASAEDWLWSSYRATAGRGSAPAWLTVSWILSRFGKDRAKAREEYRRFVAAGMGQKPKLDEWAGLWIGSEGFGARLRGLLGEKEEVREHPRRQRRPDRPDLASYLPLDLCEDRARRDEAVYGAYIEGRFSQREIADHLGLHYVTISGIVRAKELEKRQDGKTAYKGR
jgi:REP element-mobilizing transposase RayT